MVKFKEGQFRELTGYLRQRLSKRSIQALSASGEIDDELWSLMEYYSEIESVGLNFLKTSGISIAPQRRKVYKHFQAYVRQAKSYYYSAKVLSPRSSGLLYYYCFLNLAKAALVIKHQDIAGSKVTHGLDFKFRKSNELSRQTVKVRKNGIFPMLYEWYFNEQIKEQPLSIKTLLNYCTDIAYQCQKAGTCEEKILFSYYAHSVDKDKKFGWALLGIPSANLLLKFPKTYDFFLKNYEKVELSEFTCRGVFGLDAFNQNQLSFFQSTNTKKWMNDNIPPTLEARDDLFKAFKNSLQTNYFAKDFDFLISVPYKPNNQLAMDETLSIYLVMFYLSYLVRYNPQYLESLLSKKEAWLIDSFVRSCPVTFLRSMISKIIGTDYIIEKR